MLVCDIKYNFALFGVVHVICFITMEDFTSVVYHGWYITCDMPFSDDNSDFSYREQLFHKMEKAKVWLLKTFSIQNTQNEYGQIVNYLLAARRNDVTKLMQAFLEDFDLNSAGLPWNDKNTWSKVLTHSLKIA